MWRNTRKFWAACAFVASTSILVASPSFANGLLEGRPWQFQTTYDKANKAAVLDLIERKWGGYYDGFNTNIYNETNIGTQIGCSNNASSTANIADNGQAGPRTTDDSAPNISADSVANSDSTTSDGLGNAAGGGTVGADSTTVSGTQSNTGDIDSDVDSSQINSGFGNVRNGNTNQDLLNDQFNSGDQTSGVDYSTACNFAGTNVSGSVVLPGVPLN